VKFCAAYVLGVDISLLKSVMLTLQQFAFHQSFTHGLVEKLLVEIQISYAFSISYAVQFDGR
jgi:hypothetical protein